MPRRRMAVRRPRRAYYPVRRYYRMGRRYARRAYYGYRRQNAFRFSAPLPWLAGIVVGLTDFDDKIPAEVKVAAATGPWGGKYGGMVRQAGAGMCFGDLLQKNLLPRIGIKLGNAGTSSGSNGANYL